MIGNVIRRLVLGLTLIAAASAVLLLSDLDRRVGAGSKEARRRIALIQHASTTLLDDTISGMLDALAERGFVDGDTIEVQRFNAQGDMATGAAIARQATSGEYDLVLTVSTPSMQAVANNNKDGRVRHIFGAVADPFSAGIGLDRDNPAKHPPYMTGQSTFLPVDESFELMREMRPGLKTIGVAWNPAESNSEAFTKKAREVSARLGLTLLEANVDGTSGITEAVNSLVARGAEVLWIGGDNSMMAGIDSAIATARRGGIPVVSITPGKFDRGTLLDIGLDFHSVGRLAGDLTADVLGGADPATIPIRDVQAQADRQIVVNATVLDGLKGRWAIPDALMQRADVVVDAKGVHEKGGPKAAAPLRRKWKVDFVEYANTIETEEAEEGVREGLREAGLVEGRDFEVRLRNAQGDMATVGALIDAAVSEGSDLLITFSTPTLQAAIRRSGSVPVVFTLVANAFAAGAGTSDTDHLPNVTGVYLMGGYDEMVDVIREVLPNARRLGTLYVPAEVNTVFHRDQMLAAVKQRQMTLETTAVNSSSDVADAALALSTMGLDAISQLSGNLTSAAFPSLAQAARRAKVPIFAFSTSQAKAGAIVAVSRDYKDGGHGSALMAARVMRGESPARIPFEMLKKSRITVNLDAARSVGVTIPQALIDRADSVLGGSPAGSR